MKFWKRTNENLIDQIPSEATLDILRRIRPSLEYNYWVDNASDAEIEEVKSRASKVLNPSLGYRENCINFLQEIVRLGSFNRAFLGYIIDPEIVTKIARSEYARF